MEIGLRVAPLLDQDDPQAFGRIIEKSELINHARGDQQAQLIQIRFVVQVKFGGQVEFGQVNLVYLDPAENKPNFDLKPPTDGLDHYPVAPSVGPGKDDEQLLGGQAQFIGLVRGQAQSLGGFVNKGGYIG